MLFLLLRSKKCRKTKQDNHRDFLPEHETCSVFILCLQLFIFYRAGCNELIQWTPRAASGWYLLYAQTQPYIIYMYVYITERSSSECNRLTSSERNSTLIFYYHLACLSFNFGNKLIPQTSSPDLQVVKFCLLFFRLKRILIITFHALQRPHNNLIVQMVISIFIMQMQEIRQLFFLFFFFFF